eukprot:GHVQ01010748.1.p1 GENE.GHVQ01010748.1~~GHVQ01010748.1.p1  ORF type:complete len:383 (-),score=21.80 GHVQ01010748.1:218-1366(-)
MPVQTSYPRWQSEIDVETPNILQAVNKHCCGCGSPCAKPEHILALERKLGIAPIILTEDIVGSSQSEIIPLCRSMGESCRERLNEFVEPLRRLYHETFPHRVKLPDPETWTYEVRGFSLHGKTGLLLAFEQKLYITREGSESRVEIETRKVIKVNANFAEGLLTILPITGIKPQDLYLGVMDENGAEPIDLESLDLGVLVEEPEEAGISIPLKRTLFDFEILAESTRWLQLCTAAATQAILFLNPRMFPTKLPGLNAAFEEFKFAAELVSHQMEPDVLQRELPLIGLFRESSKLREYEESRLMLLDYLFAIDVAILSQEIYDQESETLEARATLKNLNPIVTSAVKLVDNPTTGIEEKVHALTIFWSHGERTLMLTTYLEYL